MLWKQTTDEVPQVSFAHTTRMNHIVINSDMTDSRKNPRESIARRSLFCHYSCDNFVNMFFLFLAFLSFCSFLLLIVCWLVLVVGGCAGVVDCCWLSFWFVLCCRLLLIVDAWCCLFIVVNSCWLMLTVVGCCGCCWLLLTVVSCCSFLSLAVDCCWLLLIVDDCWRLLMIVADGWWWLMIVDDCWWLLMIVDDGWWWLMIVNNCWWLMIVDDGWWLFMIVDDCWWLLVIVDADCWLLIANCGVRIADCWLPFRRPRHVNSEGAQSVTTPWRGAQLVQNGKSPMISKRENVWKLIDIPSLQWLS